MTVVQSQPLRPSRGKVLDPTLRSFYLRRMMDLWGLPPDTPPFFPGPNPVNVTKERASKVSLDYVATLKTDGVRYLWMLTVRSDATDPVSVMVDRSLNVYEVECWAPSDFFYEGTLFDGELVWDMSTQKRLLFLVFDTVMVKGRRVISLSYDQRMQHARASLFGGDVPDSDEEAECLVGEQSVILFKHNDHRLTVQAKNAVPIEVVERLWRERGNLSHKQDGLILTRKSAPLSTRATDDILKWKPKHSVDVVVVQDLNRDSGTNPVPTKRSSPKVLVSSDDGKTLIPCPLKATLLPSDLLERVGDLVLECDVESCKGSEVVLAPLRIRTDKSIPNVKNTFLSTMESVKHEVTLSDISSQVSS